MLLKIWDWFLLLLNLFFLVWNISTGAWLMALVSLGGVLCMVWALSMIRAREKRG